MPNIVVVGAGIVGVSTALNIQKILGTRVKIVAEKFDQDTTSWGAGGLYRPTTKHAPGVDESRLRKWSADAWDLFSSLALSELASETGMQIVSGYLLHHTEPEFIGKYDVAVNCTGLGSRDLIGDKTIYPIRGQLVKVRAPWVKHFIFTEDDTYFIQNEEFVICGGFRQRNDYNINNRKEDTEDILNRCQHLYPALKGCEVIGAWTGLRPSRSPLRVEIETMKFPRGELKVVHNYGHGSNGITLSWGTSLDAADLVKSCLNTNSKL
ncbi:hypothetical protein FSP39_016731 [Pinctada imbricata]|uniref:FAD dependent oxidoreductase domain-containing protein n=1 Tax=Pinctada imbricata TaxID=66713 RepID=A0AA88XII8_PINIB|nr:hypothetical protein FSP39_016731 [Pinctada imbricata]